MRERGVTTFQISAGKGKKVPSALHKKTKLGHVEVGSDSM